MTISQEQLLHNLEPYLPTDRFRALIARKALDDELTGAAMFVDVSGFTPLTVSLVEQFGPQRASEELKRRLNPMFEAVAGLVFTHGGSVIRFVGDGFTAWFPDNLEHTRDMETHLPGIVRASIAALEMMEIMVFFRELDLKVAVNHGSARRWIVGNPEHGLIDIIVGNAIEVVADVSNRCQRHEVRAAADSAEILKQYDSLEFERLDDGDLLLKKYGSDLLEQSRAHRWHAWQTEGDIEAILEKVKQFIDPLIQEQETADLGALSGELRYATPVFLRFTGLDYNNDPNARDKLDSYIRDVQEILKDSSGRLVSLEVADKGSVIFAVFGAPVSHGDDSRRAVHAALTMRDLPQIHPSIVSQSIGASRGLLYSGTVGGEVRHEYTSLGDETNVASRLMSHDREGRIFISEAVYEDASEWFEYEEGEVIQPKGRVGKVRTYIPIRPTQRVRRDLRRTPIVGRSTELDMVHRALDIVNRGRAHILRIEGEAGIGKSRLAAEITYQSRERSGEVASGYCLSTGTSVALLPWRPIMRALLDIDEDWSDTAQLTRAAEWLKEHNETWLARLPLLGDLLGLQVDDNTTTRHLTGSARQQALFALVIDILFYRAKSTPLTIIIEDTHWIDEVSESLIIELANRLVLQATSLLLVLIYRPITESITTSLLLKTLENMYIHEHMELGELSEEAIGEMLRNHLDGIVPGELTRFIFEKSEGNPFFVQEICDSLRESEAITRIGPRVYIDSNLHAIDLPQTVQGLILARLDKLPESEKIVLKLAAVIGKEFEIRVLFQSLPLKLSAEDIMKHLQKLESRQFITLDSLYPEPIYTFKHAITQEVTYQTLLYDQRRSWHQNVGFTLEALQPTTYERLAYHFSESDDRERAYRYLVLAGDKTAREFANQAALDYWTRALSLAPGDKEKFDLLCKRLEVLMRTAQPEAIEDNIQQIVTLADADPENHNRQVRKFRYLAEHAINQGEWEKARAFSETAIPLAREQHDLQLLWDLFSIQARVYTRLDESEAKKRATHQLRQIARQLDDNTKGLRLLLNDFQEIALEDPSSALRGMDIVYQQQIASMNDPMLEANYWNNVSIIALQNRMLIKAEEALRTQLMLWRQIGNRRMEGNTLMRLGMTYYFLGQYSAAGSQFRESHSTSSQVHDRWLEATNLVYLGGLAFRREAHGEAAAYIERGISTLEESGATGGLIIAYYLLGQNELAQKHYRDALSYFRRTASITIPVDQAQSMWQIELALAYCRVHDATLPLPEDFADAVQGLIKGDTHQFHDPDLAFYHARFLLEFFKQDMSPLREAFQEYLRNTLQPMRDEAYRRHFLELGCTTELVQLFKLDDDDLERMKTSTYLPLRD